MASFNFRKGITRVALVGWAICLPIAFILGMNSSWQQSVAAGLLTAAAFTVAYALAAALIRWVWIGFFEPEK